MFSQQIVRGIQSYTKSNSTFKTASKVAVAATLLTCAGGLYLNATNSTSTYCEGTNNSTTPPFKMPYRILGIHFLFILLNAL